MFKFLLIWRYLIRKRVALLATGAVTLVVMLVLIVLSVMSGLLQDTLDRNHNWSGDIIVSRQSLVGFPYYQEFIDRLAKDAEVFQATPVIKTIGLQGSRGRAIQMLGIKLPEFVRATRWHRTLHRLAVPTNSPAWREALKAFSDSSEPACIVGSYLLGYREIDSKERHYYWEYRYNWSVTVFPISSRGVILGSGLGERQVFSYLDDSSTRLPRIDAQCMYIDFNILQHLMMMDGTDGSPGRVNEIRIALEPRADLAKARSRIAEVWKAFIASYAQTPEARLLDDVMVQTWQEYRREAIGPAQKEKNLMVLIFAMIGAVVVFVVFAIFYLIVTEKIKDLGIIKSVGASGWGVSQIFLGYGFVVGMIGGAIGTLLGSLVVQNSNQLEAAIRHSLRWLNGVFNSYGLPWHFRDFYIWDPKVYAIDKIPDVVDWQQALVIFIAAIAASILGAAIPAFRAARLEVVETLQVT